MTAPGASRTPEFCVLFGANQGAALPLGERDFSLGHGPENDIVLDGHGIADRHASLRAADGRVLLDSAEPVWTGREPQRGRVELAFDTPFRLGSCLCVVTSAPDEWFERDLSAIVAELFRPADAPLHPAGPTENSTAPPPAAGRRRFPAGGALRRALAAVRAWEVYDSRRFLRALVSLLLFALLVFPAVDWAAKGKAHALVVATFRGMANGADTGADSGADSGAGAPAETAETARDRQQMAELQALIERVDPDGSLQVTRGPSGGLAVQGFVLSGNAYVRLLSGLSMLRFPVELRVHDRGSQVRALELLVSHTQDANIDIAVDERSGQIRVAGSLPTQEQSDRFVRQVGLELPGLADLVLEIESTDAVARALAAAVQQAALDQVRVARSASEVVLTGAVDAAGMRALETILADTATGIPIHNRVENREEGRLTAEDLGVMAILMGAPPLVLDRHGNRFGVGDRLAGGIVIVDIGMNEILVRQGPDLASVSLR